MPYTYWEGTNTGTADFTIGGQKTQNLITSWTVHDKTCSHSDHLYITFELNVAPLRKSQYRYKTQGTKFGKLNNLFKNYIENLTIALEDIKNIKDLQVWINVLQNIIEFVMEISIRKKKLTFEINPKWYINNLKIKRNRLNAVYKRSLKNPTVLKYRMEYKKERALYKKELRKEKELSWLKYCQNSSEVFGKTFKIARNKLLKYRLGIHIIRKVLHIW